ncbi:type II toxin-antitoxin system HicA family toxin [Desulfobacula sp.]|uniref:type II toxin-antitoxin system HicA family toxin n=1 Tax=Desulfobacula sp. TaxID=2593537 RepID=UPI001ED1CB26|nr:type II toxin-antitoxin system HicA family toxin [Desulfobacula sp.]
MPKGPLSLKKLLKKLKPFGIIPLSRNRGKGSEIILLKPEKKDSLKGPQYPIKNHGKGTEIYIPVINAVLRRFGIEQKDFWD